MTKAILQGRQAEKETSHGNVPQLLCVAGPYGLILAMSPAFKTVALIGRYKSRDVAVPLLFVARFLVNRGCAVLVEADTARESGVDSYAYGHYVVIGQPVDRALVFG